MIPPKDRAELVEVMAFAFYWKLTSGHGTPTEAAQAALAALEAAGVALVPKVATDAMLRAGQAAADDHRWRWCGYGPRLPGAGLDGMLFHIADAHPAICAASPYAPNPEARSDGE